MSVVSDIKILYHLLFKRVQGVSHAERLDSFYSGQADGYDEFRERLLKGRAEMIDACRCYISRHSDVFSDLSNSAWLDLGGGTGRNLAYSPQLRESFKRVLVVDLSQSLLDQADQRTRAEGWLNVGTSLRDVTTLTLSELSAQEVTKVNLVTFSYSLTMIPDWFSAIDNALNLLEPGGILAVVDFYVARKHGYSIAAGRVSGDETGTLMKNMTAQHSWFTRTFWPTWFSLDNVYLSPDHLPYLLKRCDIVDVREFYGSVPYIPIIKVPYYIFLGRKKG